jgi:thioredoxin reductase/NAD-dependent dihydropyrimidine dehydrogenase PreA subunit
MLAIFNFQLTCRSDMNEIVFSYAVYLLPLSIIIWLYARVRSRASAISEAVRSESISAGLTEPPSLHPLINDSLCCGSGACVSACPEEAIGIVNGKAVLINPTVCIGHGACELACPVSAIQLVFGTEKRGVEIPLVNPDFQSNVSGLYIAGELGGMGLIRKAAEQGSQAIASIVARLKNNKPAGMYFDVVIIGAGPAGLGASLAATAAKLKYVTLEQEDTLGGSVLHYPRAKIAMTAPIELPLIGKVKFTEVSKEKLLEFWNGVMAKHNLNVRFGERMTGIKSTEGGFEVTAGTQRYRSAAVLLAIGRRGTPRKLGVEGEDLSKVVYRLLEPEQYRGQSVLVVGGGDSAVEAGLALADVPDTKVTLSYRSEAFSRIKTKNRIRLDQALAKGTLTVMLSSQVTRLTVGEVILASGGTETTIANDVAIVCAGGELPTKLLKAIGVNVENHFGQVRP